mmetsp:Transcript_2131/g.4895  ORF Transcript_2131/g.4895 Transcript_2131/m.4895 type:complete len:450 (-) Transcript_2131:358-1707(-)|eukprot:CAMPEP_0171570712 /NCGR_PEP_ID=MMETSP0961-20121227/3111_1 /TAXON_ID=87120 /ORGANISM="Aurantiochytrium limacinum, Strain ATCCMYA-1381" /LENGTH=449 /DNA_ID=CAMNT_0012125261 /DNA_START=60 /DNA_END=1409 /DNA_ORIENTATION=-
MSVVERRLRDEAEAKSLEQQQRLRQCTVFFGFFILFLIIYTSRYADSITEGVGGLPVLLRDSGFTNNSQTSDLDRGDDNSYGTSSDSNEQPEDTTTDKTEAEMLTSKLSSFGLAELGTFFDEDEVKRNRALAEQELVALAAEDAEFDLFKTTGNRNLIFIKLHKTGSTSVAASLLRVATEYKKKVLTSHSCSDSKDYEMYFMHAPRSEWMNQCIQNPVYVTVLREPMSRHVSWNTWRLNRNYFINLPSRQCNYEGANPDVAPLRKPFQCRDDAARKKMTLRRYLKKLELTNPASRPCESCNWLNPSNEVAHPGNPAEEVARAEQVYSMVGITSNLDDFLLLLALRFGWSLESILYEKCKQQGKAGISLRDVKKYPDMYAKLENITTRESAVYNPFEAKFKAYLGRLGPGFARLLENFKRGLNNYHSKIDEAKGENKDRWIPAGKNSFYC